MVTKAAAGKRDPQAGAQLEGRVAELVARFAEIGEAHMSDLPIYNPKLRVEAVDFRPFAGQLLGALITPWFINLMLLPPAKTPVDWNELGKHVTVELPCGPRKFMRAGDAVIGAYLMLSVQSPVLNIAIEAGARQIARSALETALTPPAEQPETGGEAAAGLSRRQLLSGRGPATS